MSARTDNSINSVQLTAIVVAHDETARPSLMEYVAVSSRVSHVVEATDSIALRHELAVHHYDMAVLMLESIDDRLPACLLRYPDLRVLVVVPQRKTGSLELWLQQGASDVVSVQKPASLRHALSRLVDECRLIAELHQAKEKIELQQRNLNTILSKYPQAAKLQTTRSDAEVSPVPTRESLNQRLQAFLSATLTARRYTAMLVHFSELESAHTGDGVERTLQDLSISRAYEALRHCFPGQTLLARASKSALLMISPAGNQPSRSAANRAHEVLGSLGGLTNAESGIRINTLTLLPTSVNANEMIRRLESH